MKNEKDAYMQLYRVRNVEHLNGSDLCSQMVFQPMKNRILLLT